MKHEFRGFSPFVVEFFKELEINNNRDWFLENKARYESEIKEKTIQLVELMSVLFAEIGLTYVADKKKSLFRINRDIRFSKDKSPYKTNLGIYFPFSMSHMEVKDPQSTGLYLHIAGYETFVAGGLHMPDAKGLLSVRTRIMEDWDLFSNLINDKTFKKEFPVIDFSNSLKSTPKGFPKEHLADKWLKLKEFTPYCQMKFEDIYSSDLPEILIKKAITLKPFLEFLSLAMDNY